MQRTFARIVSVVALIILAELIFQVYTAGMGIFGAESFALHRNLGFTFEVQFLILLILTVVARPGWRLIGLSTLLLVLSFVQTALANLREDLPWVAAFHPVNALILIALTAIVARGAWARASAARDVSERHAGQPAEPVPR